MIAAVVDLERLHMELHLDDREPAKTGERQRKRRQATHPERIVSLDEDNNRNQRDHAQRHDRAQTRKDREQEGDGIGVE